MLQLLLILSMSPALTAPSTTAAVKPCQWPNTCGPKAVELASVKPCLFPNTCGPKQPAFNLLASVKPCQWPNTCGPKTA